MRRKMVEKVKEEILGRANYFAHRLNINAQSPINNGIDSNDFVILAGRANDTTKMNLRPAINPQGYSVSKLQNTKVTRYISKIYISKKIIIYLL